MLPSAELTRFPFKATVCMSSALTSSLFLDLHLLFPKKKISPSAEDHLAAK